MNWILTILIATLFYSLYQLNKRLKGLEVEKGLGFSYSFSVDAREAIHDHPKFLKESKVKSASLGKEYKDWTEKEQDAFATFIRHNVGDKGWARVIYLTSENGFLITYQAKSYFIFRDSGTRRLVSDVILGDEDHYFGNRLSFELDVRIEKDIDGNFRDFIVCYLEEYEGTGGERKAQVLFRFPYNSTDLDENYYKRLGFEIKREESEYIGLDSLGEMSGLSASTTYRQNKAEIFIVH